MYDIEKSLEQKIISQNKARPTVFFTEAGDIRLLESICYLTRYIRPVIPASEFEIRDIFDKKLSHIEKSRREYTISQTAFIDIAKEENLRDSFAKELVHETAEAGGTTSYDEALEIISDPCIFGIFCVRLNHADMVVGGSTHEPVKYFRPVIRYLKKKKVCSETGVFILPDDNTENIYSQNIIVFGDVGVNGSMTAETLAHIAVDTCTIARNIIPEDVLPEIQGAMVSYSNHGSDEGPSPELVKKASELVPELLNEYREQDERYGSILIEGEVKVNVALSQRSARYYSSSQTDDWDGPANVIICPNLDMGNMLYHLYATRFPDAKKFSIISGIGFSAVDLARDCTADDIRLGVKATILNMLMKESWEKTPVDTFFKRYRVLTINPGSTSTKVSLFEGEYEVISEELKHSAEELEPFAGRAVSSQYEYRLKMIEDFMKRNNFQIEDLDAVAGRGGLLKPIKHGTYTVNSRMLEDLSAGVAGEHASNLGGIIAHNLTSGTDTDAFIVDPVVVDEVYEKVKITGLKEIQRFVISHALNQIASARRWAIEKETFYENINVIVAHMGGGISVGAHCRGRYVDVNNALNGEGPFSPQRSGSLPAGQLIDLCFSGKYTKEQLKTLNKGAGGLIDLLGTNDLRAVEEMMDNGDDFAAIVFDALVYQISKEITSLIPAFDGEAIDRIILTGGMARSKRLVEGISRAVSLPGCGVTVYPGENEMRALAEGAIRVLQGKEDARVYE
ncbi:MAG: butyrate kinase [Spirochaetales bacterium]|uniref:Probable butyrate kinase n=1 Tax=Candidatus Thalassospirochaeta sargassi TaxID=3119039 RepID=A0AAJ1IFD7_9SPIO|nr:butyrate kinase [Spirochaetales bacterium]